MCGGPLKCGAPVRPNMFEHWLIRPCFIPCNMASVLADHTQLLEIVYDVVNICSSDFKLTYVSCLGSYIVIYRLYRIVACILL